MKPAVLLVILGLITVITIILITKPKSKPEMYVASDSSEEGDEEKKAKKIEVLTLASLAQAQATKKWCQKMNMYYDADNQSCVHTKDTCEASQKFVLQQRAKNPDSEEYTYNYEWHPEAKACVKVIAKIPDVCVRVSQMFDNQDTQVATLPYVPAELNCDKYNGCAVLKRPTCAITRSYCDKKGLSTATDNEGDDCYVTDGQEIAEAIVGSKFVRKYRADGVKGVALAAGQTFGQFVERGGLLGIAGDKIGGLIGGRAGNIISDGTRFIGGGGVYDAGKKAVGFIGSLF